MILTKGIITQTYTHDSNYYRVYIPLLKKANDSKEDATLNATKIQIAGIKDDLKVGDVVYVGFEDTEFGKPVIFGKLFTNKDNNSDNTANEVSRTLTVTDKAKLPADTTIGDSSFDSLRSGLRDELNQQISTIGSTTGLKYLTSAPTEDNLDGGLKIVVLNSEPSVRYLGYIYLITEV